MTRATVLLFASLAALAGGAAPVWAKSHADTVNPHCADDPSAPAPTHRLLCSIEGYGKFTLNADAGFKKGQPGASAQVTIMVEGRPCGRSDPMPFTGRDVVYSSCQVEEQGMDRHPFTVSAEAMLADYDSMHVNAVRRPLTKEKAPK